MMLVSPIVASLSKGTGGRMNIEEAIAELKYQARKPYSPFQVEVPKAIQLGIEAMERIQGVQEAYKEPNYFRTLHKLDLHTPLPSETEGVKE